MSIKTPVFHTILNKVSLLRSHGGKDVPSPLPFYIVIVVLAEIKKKENKQNKIK